MPTPHSSQGIKTLSLGHFGVIEPATNYRERDVMLMGLCGSIDQIAGQ